MEWTPPADAEVEASSDTTKKETTWTPPSDAIVDEKKNSESQSASSSTDVGSAFVGPSIGKIKRLNNDKAQADKFQILQKKMAADLVANPSSSYKKAYIDTLAKKGYDRAMLEQFAAPETADQQRERVANDGVNEPADESQFGVPHENDPRDQSTGLPDKVIDIIGGYIEKQGEGVQAGAEQFAKGAAKMMDYRSSVGDIGAGALNTVAGAAKAAFSAGGLVVPGLIAFNAATEAVHALPEGAKSDLAQLLVPSSSALPEKQQAEQFDKMVDLPFAAASTIAQGLGYTPEDGSAGKAALEITDLLLGAWMTHKAASGVTESAITDKESFLSVINKMQKGEATDLELQDYKDFTNSLQNITMEDVQKEAEKQGNAEVAGKIQEANVVPDDELHTKLAKLQEDQAKLPDTDKALLQPQIETTINEIQAKGQDEILSQTQEAHNEASVFDLNDQIMGLENKKEGLSEEGQQVIQQNIDQLNQQKDAIQKQSPSGVLQHTPEGTGEPGSERSGVEPVIQGDEVAPEVKVQKQEEEVIDSAQPPPGTEVSNEIKPANPKREKGVLGSLALRSELTEPVKKAITDKTLEYEQYSNKDALSVADAIIADTKEKHGDAWVDKAVDLASVKQEGIPLSINAMVLGRVIAHFSELSKNSPEMGDKVVYGEMAADVADRMDNLARDFGRFNSAIQEVYSMDEFAVRARLKKKIVDANDSKLDEKYKAGESAREKIAKAYDELGKLKEQFGSEVEKAVTQKMDEIMSQLPKEHKSYAKKAVNVLDQLEKDILSGKVAFSSVIPPPVAVAILRTAKLLIKGGMLAHEAIISAIEKHKAENLKDDTDFTEVVPKFKDYLDEAGIKDEEVKAPRRSKAVVSELENLVKQAQSETKRINTPRNKKAVTVKEDISSSVMPADYIKKREDLIAEIQKQVDIQADKNAKGVEKQLAAVKERRLKKEQKIIDAALKVFDGSAIEEAEQKVLDKIFPKKKMESAKKRQALHDKIIEAYNAGALDRVEFEKLFYDKFGLVDVEVGVVKDRLQHFAQRIFNAPEGGLKEREHTAMLNFLEDHKKQRIADWITTPFYANILSGYETHLNNAQFNIMSGIAQTALLAEKNPANAKYLAMKMLNNIPAALTQGANVLMSGLKYGDAAASESLAERRADKGPGLSHYFKLPGRLLQASDMIFNTPIKAMKRAELMLKVADEYNKSLPKDKQMNRKELQAAVDDLMFQTTERKVQALDQAKADITNLEGKDVDFTNKKIARDLKLRQFEIMENSRPEDSFLQNGIDYNAVKQEAQDFANRSLLQGRPVGSLGGLSVILEQVSQVLPISKFALTTFINVPLNLANMMIDKSPLGLVRQGYADVVNKGKRGALIPDEMAKRHSITTELTPDQRKEAYLRAVNYTTALVGVAALTGLMYTDDKGRRRLVLEVTSDGTGDYQKNKALKFATGGEFQEYTADFMGFQFSYKYNSILAPILTPIGTMSDMEKYKQKNPEAEAALASRIYYGLTSYLDYVGNQANLQGFRDIFSSQYSRGSVNLDDEMEKNAEKLARSGEKILRNLLIPNFFIQANKDAKGLMDMADKKPVQWYDYMIKDVPFVESIMKNRYDHYGRDSKSEFHLPVILVPDKLNMESEDPYYKMDLAHKYDPTFVTNRTVFNGDDEIEMTPDQMDDMNRKRGEYVREKLESKVKVDGKKTYMELLDGLSNADYKEEKNRLFKDGELYAKSKILGLDVEAKIKEDRKETRKESKASGKLTLKKLFQKYRDGKIK